MFSHACYGRSAQRTLLTSTNIWESTLTINWTREKTQRLCSEKVRVTYTSSGDSGPLTSAGPVVASITFYAVECWGSRLKTSDVNRLNKLIRRASSVLAVELESLADVSQTTMLLPLALWWPVLGAADYNVSHSLERIPALAVALSARPYFFIAAPGRPTAILRLFGIVYGFWGRCCLGKSVGSFPVVVEPCWFC